MSHCAFHGISESWESEWDSKVPKSAVCYDHHAMERHFVFLLCDVSIQTKMQSKFYENCQDLGSTAYFGGVTSCVMKSMALWWHWPWPGSNWKVGPFASSWVLLEASWRENTMVLNIWPAIKNIDIFRINRFKMCLIFSFSREWWHNSAPNVCFPNVACVLSRPISYN